MARNSACRSPDGRLIVSVIGSSINLWKRQLRFVWVEVLSLIDRQAWCHLQQLTMVLYQRKHNTNFRLPQFLLKYARKLHHLFYTLQVAAQRRKASASQHFEITITAFRICSLKLSSMVYYSKKCSRNLLYAIFRNRNSQHALNRIFCPRRNSTAFAHAFLKCQKNQSKYSHKNAFAKYRSHLRAAVRQPARQQRCRSQVIFYQIFLVSFLYLFSLLGGAIWE